LVKRFKKKEWWLINKGEQTKFKRLKELGIPFDFANHKP
jgi:hypothetical protein